MILVELTVALYHFPSESGTRKQRLRGIYANVSSTNALNTPTKNMKQIFFNFMIIMSNSFQTQKPLSTITDDRPTLFVRLLRCMFTLY